MRSFSPVVRSPWHAVAVVATVVLAIGAGAVAASSMIGTRAEFFARDSASATPSPSAPTAIPEATASASESATPSATSAPPTPAPSASPSPVTANQPATFGADDIIEVVTDDLVVRSRPGTGADFGHLSGSARWTEPGVRHRRARGR